MRDVYRHPKETLQFFEIAPSQCELEIAPGGGWYTEILEPYLHYHGMLYEAQYESSDALSAAEEQAGHAAFASKLVATPAVYCNVVFGTLRARRFSGFPAEGSVDPGLTFRNIHNCGKACDLREFAYSLKKCFVNAEYFAVRIDNMGHLAQEREANEKRARRQN